MASQLPAVLDLERVRGDTFPFTVTIKVGGTALDITGFTIVMTVDTKDDPPDSSSQVFQVTGTVIDGPAGKVQFALSTSQAATTPGDYFHDMQWTDTGGKVRTFAKGQYDVKQDITK